MTEEERKLQERKLHSLVSAAISTAVDYAGNHIRENPEVADDINQIDQVIEKFISVAKDEVTNSYTPDMIEESDIDHVRDQMETKDFKKAVYDALIIYTNIICSLDYQYQWIKTQRVLQIDAEQIDTIVTFSTYVERCRSASSSILNKTYELLYAMTNQQALEAIETICPNYVSDVNQIISNYNVLRLQFDQMASTGLDVITSYFDRNPSDK